MARPADSCATCLFQREVKLTNATGFDIQAITVSRNSLSGGPTQGILKSGGGGAISLQTSKQKLLADTRLTAGTSVAAKVGSGFCSWGSFGGFGTVVTITLVDGRTLTKELDCDAGLTITAEDLAKAAPAAPPEPSTFPAPPPRP